MIDFEIDIHQKTPFLQLLESLNDQSRALKTIHNPKTWCLSALTYALHLNDCLVLFEDLKYRWAQELPFGEAWDVDFRYWKSEIWSAANNIQSDVETTWKSLCDNDYKRFIELSKQVADGEISITPLMEFVDGKESSIQRIITDTGRKLSELFSEIERAMYHSDTSLYQIFYNGCIEAYILKYHDNLHMVKQRGNEQPYEAWEASKTVKNRPAAIEKLMASIAKDMDSYKTLSNVWNDDCYDEKSKEIDSESIARNLFINRKEIIGNACPNYHDSLKKLFYTVTMLEFLQEKYSILTTVENCPLSADQLEYNLKKSNRIFRKQVRKSNICFSKLKDLLNEHGASCLNFKYEWMGIYLFAQKHDLLQECTYVAFEEQMNLPEWFGCLADRRKCSADAMGDYSFLNVNNIGRWEDDSIIPDKTKATKKGLNRVIRRYYDLEAMYNEKDIVETR